MVLKIFMVLLNYKQCMPGHLKLYLSVYLQVFPVALTVKNLSAMPQTQVQSLDQEDYLEKGMATHFSILAWTIPQTEEPGGYNPWGHKELDMTE